MDLHRTEGTQGLIGSRQRGTGTSLRSCCALWYRFWLELFLQMNVDCREFLCHNTHDCTILLFKSFLVKGAGIYSWKLYQKPSNGEISWKTVQINVVFFPRMIVKSCHRLDGRELFTFGGHLVKKWKMPYLNSNVRMSDISKRNQKGWEMYMFWFIMTRLGQCTHICKPRLVIFNSSQPSSHTQNSNS